MKSTLTEFIKKTASEIGFDACGIAQADFLESDAKFFEAWLNKGFQAEMSYLERNFEKRVDPRALVENCKSVVVVLMNYFEDRLQPEDAPKLAKYAFSSLDYHKVIKQKLLILENRISEFVGENCFNAGKQHLFVDSAPVLERRWAEQAGLGWIGKNKLLINPDFGSFSFIGVMLINHELEFDVAGKNRCGSCRKCLDACPTKALTENDGLNANRCISYQTIEKKDTIWEQIRTELSGYIFGCDICQAVCPWNIKKSRVHKHPEFKAPEELFFWKKDDWRNLQEDEFNRIFRLSALKRAGYRKLKDNLRKG